MLPVLCALALCSPDASVGAHKSRFALLSAAVSARASRLAPAARSVSALRDRVARLSEGAAPASAGAAPPPEGAAPPSGSVAIAEAEAAISTALAPHLATLASAHFAAAPGPELALISAETPEFAELPPPLTRFWRAVDPRTRIAAIAPERRRGDFWSFPGSSGTFVFHAPQIARASKVAVPAPGNATGCGLRSFRLEFATRPGRTVYASPVYTAGGVIALERTVWFRDVAVFVNASIHEREVCAPRIRVFDADIPRTPA
jgi:hypothetical protein